MISHTGTILTPTTPNQHHAVLLHIMSFAGNVRADDPAAGESHLGRLSLARIGFLGFSDADFQAHALHGGSMFGAEGGRDGVARLLRVSAIRACAELVEGYAAGGCA